MATRTFLIPMQAPRSGTGKGSRLDPWRPKYLLELGLEFSLHNARDFCVADVTGADQALDELAAKPDVVEIREGVELGAADYAAAAEMLGFISFKHGREIIRPGFIKALKFAVLEHQRNQKPTPAMHAAVMGRRRGG